MLDESLNLLLAKLSKVEFVDLRFLGLVGIYEPICGI